MSLEDDDWQDISTALKDGTQLELAGYWDNPGFPGTGTPFRAIAAWSTLSSTSKDAKYDWYSHGLVALSHLLIKLTHWRRLRPGPLIAPTTERGTDAKSEDQR